MDTAAFPLRFSGKAVLDWFFHEGAKGGREGGM